jgi:hypothetical protein
MATFDLHDIQSLAAQGSANMIRRAVIEAKNEFNYSLAEVLEVIQGLKESDFIKTDVSRETGKPFDVYCKSIYAEPSMAGISRLISRYRYPESLSLFLFTPAYRRKSL